MKNRHVWIMGVLGAVGVFSVARAQEAPHRITAQEVAEALADPSATITYLNAAYRQYRNVGPDNDMNQELRLNGAGFLRMPDESSVLYRAYVPLYSTKFPYDDQGVGDALLSAYWVPTKGTFILGYGGALIAPTASEDYFGTGKWSAGPTLVIAKKVPGKYTIGGLLTHVWSLAGDDDREDVNLTTIQPAVTCFLNKKGTSVTLGSETTYTWEADANRWQIPVTLAVGQILPPIGKQFIGLAAGASYYIERADFTQDWDFRVMLSVVFP